MAVCNLMPDELFDAAKRAIVVLDVSLRRRPMGIAIEMDDGWCKAGKRAQQPPSKLQNVVKMAHQGRREY